MAEGGEDGQEKTEDPSQKRLDKAKKTVMFYPLKNYRSS